MTSVPATVYRFPDSPSTHVITPGYLDEPVYWLGLQWAVTSYGVETRDGRYAIERDRIHETHPGWSWESHLGKKGWCEADDIAAALAFARARWPKGTLITHPRKPPRWRGTYPQLGCMIAWDPVRDPTDARDRVAVGPYPDVTGWSDDYRSTDGACFAPFHTAEEWKRVAHLFITYNTLVVRDGLDPQAVHRAFLAIDEYRALITRGPTRTDR